MAFSAVHSGNAVARISEPSRHDDFSEIKGRTLLEPQVHCLQTASFGKFIGSIDCGDLKTQVHDRSEGFDWTKYFTDNRHPVRFYA